MAGAMYSYIPLVARFVLGTLLGVAAVAKWANLRNFAAAMDGFHVLPREWLPVPVLVVPTAETLFSALLLAGKFIPVAATGASLLFFAFGVAIAVSLSHGGKGRPCGCGWAGKLGWGLLMQNTSFIGLAVILMSKGRMAGVVGMAAVLLFGVAHVIGRSERANNRHEQARGRRKGPGIGSVAG